MRTAVPRKNIVLLLCIGFGFLCPYIWDALSWKNLSTADFEIFPNLSAPTGEKPETNSDCLCPNPVFLYDNGQSALDWFEYRRAVRGSMISNFISIPKFRISFARNTKVASTTMTAILAFLHESKKGESVEAFLKRYPTNLHREKWLQSQPLMVPGELFNQTWIKLFLVRDPYKRFLSAWRFACEGLGNQKHNRYCCARNLTCYMTELHDRMHYMSHSWEPFKSGWPGTSYWYSERFVERHFFPQTWYFGLTLLPKTVFNNMITFIRQNKEFPGNIIEVLKQHKYIPADVLDRLEEGQDHFRARWTEGKISNTNYKDVEEKVAHDPRIRDCILKLYATDYQAFSHLFEPQ